ncbi:winged helix-turn-helix domain-containing protein [Rheinheimera sp. 1928-s]|uniref:nSTAND1 domain-containing NTPase n=1 Tax=Rheinheimera sp. 1928-s TaxID=3033803 RepID=UPI0026361DC2|nr:winged helix-turn-helix domain-containing protein [Rheinheimera sp. 1928-s]MDF3123870.1 winged helix-turn-helix domain-containing protein [Rheinheimera sp. 1928-s]
MIGTFFFGEWQVDPSANTLRLGKQLIQLEPKAMDVLVLLCQNAGEVHSSDEIVSICWPQAEVGDNPLHKIITQIRKALGDSATSPSYIETIRKRGYRTLAQVTFPLGQEESATPQSWQGGSPFPGLQAYDARYAKVFFGRGSQIDTLLERIAQQVQYGRAFCLVLGPSGSGKSSLINAGVMPNLMQNSGYNGVKVESYSSLDLADLTPGQLLMQLASALLDWDLADQPVFDGCSAEQLAEKLQHQMDWVLQSCKKALQHQNESKSRFAIFIDRLEVLLSSPLFSEEERLLFIDRMEQLATSGVVVVLSACRNEFYPLLVTYPSLMAGKARGAHFDLAPPGRADLLQMIRLPAIAANLSWDLDPNTAVPLDELLCSEAASNPDALPMLQYTLQELYLQRSDSNQLLFSVYKNLGGIEGAIGKNAEQAIALLSTAEKDSLPRVLSLLVTLREDEQSITSRTALWQQLQNDAERALVQAMVEHRLFVSHLQNAAPCFSIAHEALLRRWPRATAWIAEHHQSLSVKSRLQHLTKRWLAEDKHSAYLLADGKPLAEAQQLAQNGFFTLDANEKDFIQASGKRSKLVRTSRRLTFVLLCVLTFTAVLMSFRSFEAEKQAQQKRLAAESLLGFMVGDFADKLRSIGRMDLLDGISNKALEYFSDFSDAEKDQYLSAQARLQHGQTLEAMGEVAYSRDKIDEAKTALLAAREKLVPVLAEQPDNLELLKTLGANAFWLGQIQYDAKNWLAAKPELELYYSYSQAMYRVAPESFDALMELSYATNSLGSLAMKLQEFEQATAFFNESLTLKLLAQAKEPANTTLIGDIADTRSWLASAVLAQGDIWQAIEVHKKIQSEFQRFSKTKEPDGYLLDKVFGSYRNLSALLGYQGLKHEAFELNFLAQQLLEQALQLDPENEVWHIDLFNIKLQLMRLNAELKDPRINYTPELLKTQFESNRKRLSETRYLNLFRIWYIESVRYYQMTAQWDKSAELLQQALPFYRENFRLNMDSREWRYYLAYIELVNANQLKFELKLEQSQQACQHVKEVLAPMKDQVRTPQYIHSYATALSCLGELDQNVTLRQHIEQSGLVIEKL